MEWGCIWNWIGNNSEEITAIATSIAAIGAIAFGWIQWRINVKLYDAQIPTPVLIREGMVSYDSLGTFDAEGLGTTPIVFRNAHAIAARISGFAVIEKIKYELVWGNSASVTTVLRPDGTEEAAQAFSPSWDWVGINSTVGAIPVQKTGVALDEPNKVHVTYYDIEGRKYESLMSDTYFTTVKKLIG